MKINFLLPFISQNSEKAFEVIYTYANGFAEKGYDVFLYHLVYSPSNIDGSGWSSRQSDRFLQYVFRKKFYTRPSWFSLDENIKSFAVVDISSNLIRNADITIASGMDIALSLSKLNTSKGVKYLLIQNEKDFFINPQQLGNFSLPVHYVVTNESTRNFVGEYTKNIPDIITSVRSLEGLINSKLSYFERLQTVSEENYFPIKTKD